MEKVRIYSLKNEDGVLLPYFMTSTSDKEVSKFALKYYEDTVNTVEDKQQKVNMVEMLRKCSFVVIAEVDLETGSVSQLGDTLFVLNEFMKNVKPDIKLKEGKDGQMQIDINEEN